MSSDVDAAPGELPADSSNDRQFGARRVTSAVAFVGGLVFLLGVAAMSVDDFIERARTDFVAEALEVERWECVEAFVREAGIDESLRVQIEPADDTYIRQRVVESIYPLVDLTDAESADTLRVVVGPGDDPDASCRGLTLSIARP